jgi:hypothetical protein
MNTNTTIALGTTAIVGVMGFGFYALTQQNEQQSLRAQLQQQSEIVTQQQTQEPRVQVNIDQSSTVEQHAISPLPVVPVVPVLPNVSNARGPETCWFQMTPGALTMKGTICTISSRINVNNDKVWDVIEPNGTKRSVVLWENGVAEVFRGGKRYEGQWNFDQDQDVKIQINNGGTFVFRPNN